MITKFVNELERVCDISKAPVEDFMDGEYVVPLSTLRGFINGLRLEIEDSYKSSDTDSEYAAALKEGANLVMKYLIARMKPVPGSAHEGCFQTLFTSDLNIISKMVKFDIKEKCVEKAKN